ncbi:hypothetical protein [Bifidobacterium callitrichos]|uniref:hypothetical protein n=1 Tax=Bifidobacterium callitrichos TaxID=762209 RepID=UPI00168AB912|nr:hypothetical protein [Bifidobacterium callitrichos]
MRDCVDLLVSERGRLVLTITPIREGANVNVESAMAARTERSDGQTAALESVEIVPVRRSVLRRS